MTPSLSSWMADADALMHLTYFKVPQATLDYAHIHQRTADYYIALVGALFHELRENQAAPAHWARLGNAFSQFQTTALATRADAEGIAQHDAAFFAACAYYCGGFPASAYLSIRSIPRGAFPDETSRACYDLLVRPSELVSGVAHAIQQALSVGDNAALTQLANTVATAVHAALQAGPMEYIPARVLEKLVTRLLSTNIRSVLPGGFTAFWTPLVDSFLRRTPPTWEFFPSQIAAINAGLLHSPTSFSLQMPTGAGKTTLCETLLFAHAAQHPASVSVLVVPYRSLASELRESLVRNLNALGIRARCAYGGTVPTSDEVHSLDETRVIVATPEALSGLLSADAAFFQRISLVICDEGHLLDGEGRGVGLELLLARMRARPSGPPRFVFVSAIVPNIEEINAWLGGTPESVVRSDYRPAIAEFARLASVGKGKTAVVDLVMHPHEPTPVQFTISQLLSRADFTFTNPKTGRAKTYPHSSVKAVAVATARKALPMGAVAVFSANKNGNQGCIGLAEELLEQLQVGLPMPRPIEVAMTSAVTPVAAYLTAEFGAGWIGTRMVTAGAIVHHGDIPQEVREVLERLLRQDAVKFVICTSTLAEGVNLPIRTLVLYSVERVLPGGTRQPMLARDIKNLVGRAGRAGSNTKGLVICANERHWPAVAAVAKQTAGEPVRGSLRELMTRLRDALAIDISMPSNQWLETAEWCYPLLDGIDATLLDLAAAEIGDEQLNAMALELADRTFAASQATEESKDLLRTVFQLRAERINAVRTAGQLDWIRSTGARVRLLDSVVRDLWPRRPSWSDIENPTDPGFVTTLLEWAWTLPEVMKELRTAFQLDDGSDTQAEEQLVSAVVAAWLAGGRYAEIAIHSGLDVDTLLGVHTQVVAFGLQTALEQGISLLKKLMEAQGQTLSEAAALFPEHLRYGVPTRLGCELAAHGVRHRHAYVRLGDALTRHGLVVSPFSDVPGEADRSLAAHEREWRAILGDLIYENTRVNLRR